MSLAGIRALTFDTGGTVLDWHTGFRDAFAVAGRRHRVERDWAALANELRRRSMETMLDLGANGPPDHNFDDAHRVCLDALLEDEGLTMFDAAERRSISWDAPHQFVAWPDVRDGLAALRERCIVASFSLLSYRLIIDTSRRNGLSWDAVLSCEGLGLYKLLPESYRRAAELLQLRPDQCLMVACHPFDLDAARAQGFRTALVRRPREWGSNSAARPPLPPPGSFDIEVNDLNALAGALA